MYTMYTLYTGTRYPGTSVWLHVVWKHFNLKTSHITHNA